MTILATGTIQVSIWDLEWVWVWDGAVDLVVGVVDLVVGVVDLVAGEADLVAGAMILSGVVMADGEDLVDGLVDLVDGDMILSGVASEDGEVDGADLVMVDLVMVDGQV